MFTLIFLSWGFAPNPHRPTRPGKNKPTKQTNQPTESKQTLEGSLGKSRQPVVLEPGALAPARFIAEACGEAGTCGGLSAAIMQTGWALLALSPQNAL